MSALTTDTSGVRRYPYIVVRLMACVYQREEVVIQVGESRAHVGFRDSFVHHPTPLNEDGVVSLGCRNLLIAAALERVQRTGYRMAIVWTAEHSTFVERDGTTIESGEPPSGGIGSGVGRCGIDLDFDQKSGSRKTGSAID